MDKRLTFKRPSFTNKENEPDRTLNEAFLDRA
jgi:hypothetical protein